MSQWIVIGYSELGSTKDKRLFVCKSKKLAVGAVGILLDHHHSKHIDVMRDDRYGDHKLTEYKKKPQTSPVCRNFILKRK